MADKMEVAFLESMGESMFPRIRAALDSHARVDRVRNNSSPRHQIRGSYQAHGDTGGTLETAVAPA